jgi:Skp family chaperone for outer membrane proteins
MAREDEEWVSKREFEILKEEFAGVKSELEKINKDIQSLKRGEHACSRQHYKWACI